MIYKIAAADDAAPDTSFLFKVNRDIHHMQKKKKSMTSIKKKKRKTMTMQRDLSEYNDSSSSSSHETNGVTFPLSFVYSFTSFGSPLECEFLFFSFVKNISVHVAKKNCWLYKIHFDNSDKRERKKKVTTRSLNRYNYTLLSFVCWKKKKKIAWART